MPSRPRLMLACGQPIRASKRRLLSSASPSRSLHFTKEGLPPAPTPPPPRWLSDLRSRVGKCIIFGCNAAQIAKAAGILRVLAEDWRRLTAGSDGFLTGGRRGLEGQKVVWGEQDSFGHVNNVNYFRYAESARVNWITNFAVQADAAHRAQWSELMTPKETGLIMRSLKAEYKFPMTYPDRISVYHKLRVDPSSFSTPQSSFVLDCIVLSHNARRIAAKLEEDIVIYDYKAARKTSMPDYMVALFSETFHLQEQELRWARASIWGLMEEVEHLEKETWDRPDAVEEVRVLQPSQDLRAF